MITFTIGFLAGAMIGVIVGATLASGRIASLIKENARLRQLSPGAHAPRSRVKQG